MCSLKQSNCFLSLFCCLCLLSFASCSEKGDTGTDEEGTDTELAFDQGAMLTHIGEKVIFPHYADFKNKATNLHNAVKLFTESPTEEALENARETLKETYLAWQRVNLYEFGPAEDLALRQNMNEFPTQYVTIENNIASGTWDLTSFRNIDQKGLPALDYLLFREGSSSAMLPDFTTAENAAKRRQYLQEVADEVHELATEVYNGWDPQQGNYLGTFNTTLGNSANSSLSLLVNNVNIGYEIIKNKKLNIPLGNRTIDGQPIPRAVEAYYSGISLELMKANLQSVEDTFRGVANGTDGPGLDDYLDAHYKAGNIQNDLTDQILMQLAKAQQAVNALPEPLSEAVTMANEAGNKAYTELQSLVVYLKNDMPQALSVLISYVDNDGD